SGSRISSISPPLTRLLPCRPLINKLDRALLDGEHRVNKSSLTLMPAAPDSLPDSTARLKARALPVADCRTLPFGLPALDGGLAGGGLRAGALHEVAAKSCSLTDDAAATLFLAGIAAREAEASGRPA